MSVLDRPPPREGGTAAATEFRLLGPVRIRDAAGREVVPPGSKQRALLAALVIHAGELLSAERLTEELWGGALPANAPNALHAHVARLRRLLPARPGPAEGPEWITTLPSGYVLRLGTATTDVERFGRLSSEGRAQVASDPPRAARLLRRALSLWHGPALQDVGAGPICAREADRLEEMRLCTLEMLHEANLRLARHGEIIGELERLTADHPLRERFYDLLMVALYRSGRQAEALGVYERARRCLVTALGIEPGPALRGRMEAILGHSPGLGVPGPCRPDGGVPDPGGEIAWLRRRVEELTREHERLARRLESVAVRPPEPV
ncbi:AfsR/SARP family transcriptional regulator [Streptomyces viridosporus]|uniref:AfsR/SARP family transcriptional regulator n=1 Tax=Streptomyces viridosporus TaxID=67581 RepID=UPI0009C01408|nr:AfsR/SARP family transcriptional regulator [Streptomyces viridosporus]